MLKLVKRHCLHVTTCIPERHRSLIYMGRSRLLVTVIWAAVVNVCVVTAYNIEWNSLVATLLLICTIQTALGTLIHYLLF